MGGVWGVGIVGMGGRGIGVEGGVHGGQGLRGVAFSAVATGGCGVVGGGVEEEFREEGAEDGGGGADLGGVRMRG